MAIDQHAMLDMVFDRAGEYHIFDIAPDSRQFLRCQRVIDPFHLLLDDRAFVQIGRHIMGRGADQLDPAVIGLLVRIGPLEAGQEGMMDVDRPSGQPAAQFG
jgi:hypothetical protein